MVSASTAVFAFAFALAVKIAVVVVDFAITVAVAAAAGLIDICVESFLSWLSLSRQLVLDLLYPLEYLVIGPVFCPLMLRVTLDVIPALGVSTSQVR